MTTPEIEFWAAACNDPEHRDLHGWPPYDVLEVGRMIAERLGLQPASRQVVLDLGCGIGRTTKQLARNHPLTTFVGLDVIPSLVDKARRDAPPNTRFAEIAHRAIDSYRFTHAYSITVLQHLPEEVVRRYLHQVAWALWSRGGRFVFTVALGDEQSFLNYQISTAQLHHWCNVAGLNVIDVEQRDRRGWTWVTTEKNGDTRRWH